MDEASARKWVASTFDVPRETMDRLDRLVDLLRAENAKQNLVSAPTLEQVWNRHIADSAQLLLHAPREPAHWLDLGTGAGFPGLIVAVLYPGPVTMVEQRRKRVEFLICAAALLQLPTTTRILGRRAETADIDAADIISARAFAPLGQLLALGERFATAKTRWVLPKGKNAQSELEAVESSWQGSFRLEASLTDPDALIVVAEGVRRRAEGKSR